MSVELAEDRDWHTEEILMTVKAYPNPQARLREQRGDVRLRPHRDEHPLLDDHFTAA